MFRISHILRKSLTSSKNQVPDEHVQIEPVEHIATASGNGQGARPGRPPLQSYGNGNGRGNGHGGGEDPTSMITPATTTTTPTTPTSTTTKTNAEEQFISESQLTLNVDLDQLDYNTEGYGKHRRLLSQLYSLFRLVSSEVIWIFTLFFTAIVSSPFIASPLFFAFISPSYLATFLPSPNPLFVFPFCFCSES